MTQVFIKILASLITEKLFRELMAAGLELIINHTDTECDNKMLEPIIKALKGE